MECSNTNCGCVMLNKICSKKSNGVFYFICEHCMTVHKAEIDTDTFELKIGLAPDEDMDNVRVLMTESFKEYEGEISFDLI